MNNHLSSILSQWYTNKDTYDWVLGTIYHTEGACYRKAGAMMMFSSLGQQLGMLSGGCLESNIQTHAREVMQTNKPLTLVYDDGDEDNIAFSLGIGCGGIVKIMLTPISASNNYQSLAQVYEALSRYESGIYIQTIPNNNVNYQEASFSQYTDSSEHKSHLFEEGKRQHLLIPIQCQPHILLIGGGVDARPMVAMAKQLGWRVSVWDSRPANARREFFMDADHLLRCAEDKLPLFIKEHDICAAVLMSHNVQIDARVLKYVNDQGLQYIGLLGPVHRKEKVLKTANLKGSDITPVINGPAGFNIGGELPESIALSILSQCHAALHNRLYFT